jgi:hypothetical protein
VQGVERTKNPALFVVHLAPRDRVNSVVDCIASRPSAAQAKLEQLVVAEGAATVHGDAVSISSCKLSFEFEMDADVVASSQGLCMLDLITRLQGKPLDKNAVAPLLAMNEKDRERLGDRKPLSCKGPWFGFLSKCDGEGEHLSSCTQRNEIVDIRNELRAGDGKLQKGSPKCSTL